MTTAAIIAELRRLNASVQTLAHSLQVDLAADPAQGKVRYIQGVVADHFNISTKQLCTETRRAHICWPRQVAMFLCRELTSASAEDIAEAFGKRDHGTVLHAAHVVKNRCETNKAAALLVLSLQAEISQQFQAHSKTCLEVAA
jgi:chromosomal replication initiation ATPase DnaA